MFYSLVPYSWFVPLSQSAMNMKSAPLLCLIQLLNGQMATWLVCILLSLRDITYTVFVILHLNVSHLSVSLVFLYMSYDFSFVWPVIYMTCDNFVTDFCCFYRVSTGWSFHQTVLGPSWGRFAAKQPWTSRQCCINILLFLKTKQKSTLISGWPFSELLNVLPSHCSTAVYMIYPSLWDSSWDDLVWLMGHYNPRTNFTLRIVARV